MEMFRQKLRIFLFPAFVLFFTGISRDLRSQATNEQPEEEIVANLAAGRAVIAVVKDAIVMGSLEDRIEPQTLPPAIVALSSRRAAVLLGAAEWIEPAIHSALARLPLELPRLHPHGSLSSPHLQPTAGGEAIDVEAFGQALLDRLNQVAAHVHGKLDIPPGQPVVELILADYVEDYGPEVWLLTYSLEQQPERGDYWTTQFSQPQYQQMWPPEKGQPHSLVEFSYPPDDAKQPVLDLLRRGSSGTADVAQRYPEVASALLAGESRKILAAGATSFLRSCLQALAVPSARAELAVVSQEQGFQWIIPPPAEDKSPPLEPSRPPGAPTLITPPPQSPDPGRP